MTSPFLVDESVTFDEPVAFTNPLARRASPRSAKRQRPGAPAGRAPSLERAELVGVGRPLLDRERGRGEHLELARDVAADARLAHHQQARAVGREAGRLDVARRRVGVVGGRASASRSTSSRRFRAATPRARSTPPAAGPRSSPRSRRPPSAARSSRRCRRCSARRAPARVVCCAPVASTRSRSLSARRSRPGRAARARRSPRATRVSLGGVSVAQREAATRTATSSYRSRSSAASTPRSHSASSRTAIASARAAASPLPPRASSNARQANASAPVEPYPPRERRRQRVRGREVDGLQRLEATVVPGPLVGRRRQAPRGSRRPRGTAPPARARRARPPARRAPRPRPRRRSRPASARLGRRGAWTSAPNPPRAGRSWVPPSSAHALSPSTILNFTP